MLRQLVRPVNLKLYQRLSIFGEGDVTLKPRPMPKEKEFCKGIVKSKKDYYPYQCLLGSYDFKRHFNTSTTVHSEKSLPQKLLGELSAFKTIDFTQLKCAPFPAILYGFGGIVPFVVPPLYLISVSFTPLLATTQLMYGATILAFVGGVKWGNALAKGNITHDQIGISTIPSLVAWSALMVPDPLGFVVVSVGLVGALYADLMSSGYPPWFLAMRATLTGIAVTSLLTTCLCCLLH